MPYFKVTNNPVQVEEISEQHFQKSQTLIDKKEGVVVVFVQSTNAYSAAFTAGEMFASTGVKTVRPKEVCTTQLISDQIKKSTTHSIDSPELVQLLLEYLKPFRATTSNSGDSVISAEEIKKCWETISEVGDGSSRSNNKLRQWAIENNLDIKLRKHPVQPFGRRYSEEEELWLCERKAFEVIQRLAHDNVALNVFVKD